MELTDEPEASPPRASQGLGENGELEECGGVRGKLWSPGQSGSDPLTLSSSQSLRTWFDKRGGGGGSLHTKGLAG